jgi:hypothetical protein
MIRTAKDEVPRQPAVEAPPMPAPRTPGA